MVTLGTLGLLSFLEREQNCPKQTTESKVYDYRINKGTSWQLGAIFFLRLENRILQCHPHWWETFLHFPLYRCPSNNRRNHKKNFKVQHRYHNTKNVIFIKTAEIRFHLNQSSSGGLLINTDSHSYSWQRTKYVLHIFKVIWPTGLVSRIANTTSFAVF